MAAEHSQPEVRGQVPFQQRNESYFLLGMPFRRIEQAPKVRLACARARDVEQLGGLRIRLDEEFLLKGGQKGLSHTRQQS